MTQLTKETKDDIIESFLVLAGSGVPEHGLIRMLADRAIGLLENQRDEWFLDVAMNRNRRIILGTAQRLARGYVDHMKRGAIEPANAQLNDLLTMLCENERNIE